MPIEQCSSRIANALEENERLRAEGERLEAVGEALRDDMQTMISQVTAMAEALEEAQAEADKYYQLWQSVVSHCNTVADERDRLRAELDALKPLAASAQKAAEQITAMTAELHEQRDEIERLREMQGGFRHLDDLRRAMCDCADDNARLRAEVEALRAALQRIADRRYDLCPTQIVHIVNTALRSEVEK